jgi:hypothetical protein
MFYCTNILFLREKIVLLRTNIKLDFLLKPTEITNFIMNYLIIFTSISSLISKVSKIVF